MFITLYFIVTRLPHSLRSVRDHFLSLDPTSLTADLLEHHLLVAETSAVTVGAARPSLRGAPPPPLPPPTPLLLLQTSLLLRTSGLLLLVRSAAAAMARVTEVVEVAAVVEEVATGVVVGATVGVVAAVGLVEGVGVMVAAVEAAVGVAAMAAVGLALGGGGQRQQQQRRSETQSPQQLREWCLQRGASGGSGSCPYVIRTGERVGQTCGRLQIQHRCFSRLDDTWRTEFGDDAELPRWADILSAERDCYRCVPPDPGIAVAALGASESGTLPGTASAQALHTFTLDSGASHCFFRDITTLTPLPAPVPVGLADPSGGLVVARSSTVLPCPAVLSNSLSGLHLPSFSTNLVSTAALQDAMVVIVTIGLNVPKTKDGVHRRISAERLQTLIAFCSQLQMTCYKMDLERLDVAYNKQFRLHDLIKD
ncbi:unnamed protein product [Closterium sp. NIES-54]